MISLEALRDLAQLGVERYGYWGILGLGLSVAVYQPMAPDLFLAAGPPLGMDPYVALPVAVAGTLAGSAGGYALGRYLGRRILRIVRLKEKYVERAEDLFRKYGTLGVALAAISPVPLRETSWLAGTFRMPLGRFLLAVAVGIVPRYCGAVLLGHVLGKTF